jgi:hypothetical protein
VTDENTNLHKCAIGLPDIGPYAHVLFDVPALEAIEAAVGDDYSTAMIFDQLESLRVSTIRLTASHALRNCTVDEFLACRTMSAAARVLADALSTTMYGLPVEEELARRHAAAVAQMEAAHA